MSGASTDVGNTGAGNLANHTAINLSGANGGLEKVTVEATGAANSLLNLDAQGVQELTIAGDKGINLFVANTANANNLGKVTVTNTAGATVNVSSAQVATAATATPAHVANEIDFVGGAGNDTIWVNAAQFLAASGNTLVSSFDGGAGTNKVVHVGALNVDSTTAATFTKAINDLKNIKVLEVNNGAATIAANLVTGVTDFAKSGTGNATFTGVSNNTSFTFDRVNGVTGNVTMKTGANTANVNLQGTTAPTGAATSSTTAALNLTGVEVLNLNSTALTAGGLITNNAGLVTMGDNGTANIGGTENLTVAFANRINVKASSFADILNVTGSAGNDLIQSGSGNDIITGARGADALTGGAGADTFFYSYGNPAGASNQQQTELITISGNVNAGDVFTATVNGIDYSYVAQAGEAIAQVQAGLAVAITAAGINVTQPAPGQIQLQAAQAATTFTVAVSTTNAAAGADNTQPAVAAVTANAAAVPEVETLTLNNVEAGDVFSVNTGTGVRTVTADVGETTAQVATRLATAINGQDGLTATANGAVITVTGPAAGTAFTLTPTTTNVVAGTNDQTLAAGNAVAGLSAQAQQDQITVTRGTQEAGDIFTLSIGGNVFATYTTLGNEADNAAVATALNSAIQGAGGYGAAAFTSAVAGNVITLTAKTAGTGYTAAVQASNVVLGTDDQAIALQNVLANQAAQAQSVDYTIANPELGDVYSLTINGVTVSHTVRSGQSANDVADALNTAIDGVAAISAFNDADAAGDAVVTLTGATNGAAFTHSSAATNRALGTDNQTLVNATTTTGSVAVAKSDTITIGNTVEVGDQFSVTVNGTTHTVTAGSASTATTIATALATAINNGGQAALVNATSNAGVITLSADNAGTTYGVVTAAQTNRVADADTTQALNVTTVVGSNASAATASDSNVNTIDTITDFVKGSDKIDLTVFNGVAGGAATPTNAWYAGDVTASTGATNLAAALGLALSDVNGASQTGTVAFNNATAGYTGNGEQIAVLFQYQGDTYAFVDNGNGNYSANDDLLIKLTGTHGLSEGALTVADFFA